MSDAIKKLGEIGIIPVVAIDDARAAAPLAQALLEVGLPCAEITFRTAAAVLREISVAYPSVLLGADTVLTVDQVEQAKAAGARSQTQHSR